MERSSHSSLGAAADQRLAFAIARRCPLCGCSDLHRSTIHSEDEEQLSIFLSPYRCNDCGARFWTVSRRTRRIAIGMIVLALTGVMVALLMSGLATPSLQPSTQPSAAATSAANA